MGGGTVWKYDAEGNRIQERKKVDMMIADNDFTDMVAEFRYGTGATAGLVMETTAPDGTVTRYSYDEKRRVVRTDVDGVVLAPESEGVTVTTRMEYDNLGRLVKTTDSAGRETAFGYSGSLLVSTHKGGAGPESVTETVEYDKF